VNAPAAPELSRSEERLLAALVDVVQERAVERPAALQSGGRLPETARRAVPRRGVLLGLAAAGVAVASVGIPAILPSTPSGSASWIAGANASAFLGSMAQTASTQDGNAKDAAFWYIRTRSQVGSEPATVREEWLGHRDVGRWRQTGGDAPIGGHLDGPATWFLDYRGTRIGWDDLWALPTDPKALEAVLRADALPPADSDISVFGVIGDLLRGPTPPALRAALYRVAAGIPNVRLVGEVTDSEGRRGVAIEHPGLFGVTRYVIDPATSRLLMQTSTDPAPCPLGTTPCPAAKVRRTTVVLAEHAVQSPPRISPSPSPEPSTSPEPSSRPSR